MLDSDVVSYPCRLRWVDLGVRVWSNVSANFCKNAVESEIHFLLECPVYDRDEFLRLTTLNLVPDNVDRIKLCMDNYQKMTVKFVTKLWNERQNLITN